MNNKLELNSLKQIWWWEQALRYRIEIRANILIGHYLAPLCSSCMVRWPTQLIALWGTKHHLALNRVASKVASSKRAHTVHAFSLWENHDVDKRAT